MDACLLDTARVVVMNDGEAQAIFGEHFPVLRTEQIIFGLAFSHSHIVLQNRHHLTTKGICLNFSIFIVPKHNLPALQINISVLDVADCGSPTPAVQQKIDNYPVPILTEIGTFGRLFSKRASSASV